MANGELNSEAFAKLKHDIRNQLSNIQLALEGMKFEVDEQNSDMAFYLGSLAQSARKIDVLLDDFGQN